jgi:transcriptional regulator with XRE-family HTH domain
MPKFGFLDTKFGVENTTFKKGGQNIVEIIIEKAKAYILALKEAGDFTYEDMATISGVAQSTIRNFCTGTTEKNPGFATIAKLVVSMGGDLNELIGYEKKKEIEVNSTVTLKETYEMRIADIIKSYETRIDDIKALCETRIADVQKCCETRIADMKKNYEERLNDFREMFQTKII